MSWRKDTLNPVGLLHIVVDCSLDGNGPDVLADRFYAVAGVEHEAHFLALGQKPPASERVGGGANAIEYIMPWCGSYVTAYLERDIRTLTAVSDLSQCERFLVACATRTGQILNLSELARDIGISTPTAWRWLSLLETGHQVYLLYPYFRNIGKRMIKSPKLYFTDPALCSYLLGLHDREVLLSAPYFGNLFETMVVCDFLKRFLHFGLRPSMYYVRSRDGLEVDLVIDLASRLHLFEVKGAATITDRHAVSLKRLADELRSQAQSAGIISCTAESSRVTGEIMNYGWTDVLVS